MNNHCVDCGMPTSGTRCRICNGRFIKLEAARTLAKADAELLAMVDGEKLSPARLAAREGGTRQAAGNRIRRARERQKLLSPAS